MLDMRFLKKFNLPHKHRHIIRNSIFAVLGICAVVLGGTLIWISTIQLPDFSSFDSRKTANSTKIYDRTGEIVLFDLGSDMHRTEIPYATMGANIKNAVVAIEDSEFYNHAGVRPTAMIRAAIANLTHGGQFVQGGSTITQQVIKKSLLSDDKTIVRKLKEIILAMKLEREYTKDEILGLYLNVIPYGGNIYGIAEASTTYFGKKPADLTLAEAAYLAAIPNAPTRFSPYGSHKDLLEQRKNLVLSREKELGFITDDEYISAKAEQVTWKPQQVSSIKAPHFVFWIKDYIEQKYGADVVDSGLKVITTLDYDLQEKAEQAVRDWTNGSKRNIEKLNGAMVAIDPKTGQILTMVGSRNYFDKEIDGAYNVAIANRQPGSSIKPYMYVTAFEKGFLPETVLFDVPTEFSSVCDPYGKPLPGYNSDQCYSPENYDGKFRGPISLRLALGNSINVPAVKMLYITGIKNVLKTARDLGVTTLTDPDRYGLSLVLGGGEIKLLEHTSSYATFASGGERHPYAGVLSVEDRDGNILETWEDHPVQVLDKNATLELTSVLADNSARTMQFGPNSPLYIPERQVAAKSGTTNNYRDSWAMGYSPSIAVGAWIGKNDNTPVGKNILASPMWHQFMQYAAQKYPDEQFELPIKPANYSDLPPVVRGYWQGGSSYTIDTISGGLATEQTPPEYRKEMVVTDVHDILYWIDKDNILGGKPSNPYSDPLFKNWETAVRNWWSGHSGSVPIISEASRPTTYDTVHTDSNAPKVTIVSPTPTTTYGANDRIITSISATGTFPLKRVDIYWNSALVGSAPGNNPNLTFSPSEIPGTIPGNNTLTAVATDTAGNTGNSSVIIQIEG